MLDVVAYCFVCCQAFTTICFLLSAMVVDSEKAFDQRGAVSRIRKVQGPFDILYIAVAERMKDRIVVKVRERRTEKVAGSSGTIGIGSLKREGL
jgi:hypothetical protein